MAQRYQPMAEIEPDSDNFYYIAEAINDDLVKTEYSVFDVVHGGYYLVKEYEDGDWEVVGSAVEIENGDVFGATGDVAKNAGDEYKIVSEPYGERKIVWDHSDA